MLWLLTGGLREEQASAERLPAAVPERGSAGEADGCGLTGVTGGCCGAAGAGPTPGAGGIGCSSGSGPILRVDFLRVTAQHKQQKRATQTATRAARLPSTTSSKAVKKCENSRTTL